jgi:uncharacterized protein (DUF362 family)
MDRRDFFKKTLSLAVAAGISSITKAPSLLAEEKNGVSKNPPDFVAVRNGSPDKMFDKGIAALGGMRKFIRKGQTVVVKPNIAWIANPEGAADTNPILIKRIIEQCFGAGASRVYVFDHTCDDSNITYEVSGIEKAATEANATVVQGNKESYFQEVRVPGAHALKQVKVHELILESDVFINVPILKHHGSARMTCALKNLMGVVWDRHYYHRTDLSRCIAEFPLYRNPDLTIVDAYNILTDGPRAKSLEHVINKKMQLISKDMVALDVAASKILGEEAGNITYIKIANDLGVGNSNLDGLNIKRIDL